MRARTLPRRGPASPPRVLHPAEPEPSFFVLFGQWQDWLVPRCRGPRTPELYAGYLLRFLAKSRLDPGWVTEEDVTAFLARLKRQGATVEGYKRALKSWYRWAVRRGHYPEDPTVEIQYKDSASPPAESLEWDEYVRVIYTAANRRPYPYRAWALILTMETGGRIGSIAGIRMEDVSTEAGKLLRFAVAKGDRPYSVRLTPLAALAVRELLPFSDGERLIPRVPTTIWEWWHECAVAAGLPRRKQRTHILRDTAATNLLNRVKNPRIVQEFLNHADLSQLHRYAAVTDRAMTAALAEPLADGFDE